MEENAQHVSHLLPGKCYEKKAQSNPHKPWQPFCFILCVFVSDTRLCVKNPANTNTILDLIWKFCVVLNLLLPEYKSQFVLLNWEEPNAEVLSSTP